MVATRLTQADYCDRGDRRSSLTLGTAVTLSTQSSTHEANEPSLLSGCTTSVWFTVTIAAAGQVTVSLAGSTFDSVLGVYRDAATGGFGGLTLAASNDDCVSGVVVYSCVTFAATASTTYAIQVDGYKGDVGSLTIVVALAAATSASRTTSVTVTWSSSATSTPASKSNDYYSRHVDTATQLQLFSRSSAARTSTDIVLCG